MEKNNVEILRSVPDGGMLTIPMSSIGSIAALRVRASELNAHDGWMHYIVRTSKIEDKVIIAAIAQEEIED